jgi:hypothetical protein
MTNKIEIIHTKDDYRTHKDKVNDYLAYSGGHVINSFVGTADVNHKGEPGHFYTIIEYTVDE